MAERSGPDAYAIPWLGEAKPMFEGVCGKAWKFPLPDDDGGDWRRAAGLDANFLIFAPGAHPFWSWHVLMAIHLRDVPGQDKPPVKRSPSVTHELMVYALDPDVPPPDPRNWPLPADGGEPRLRMLSPPDAVVQFEVGSDEHATEIVTLAAQACTAGHLIPDSDHRALWDRTIATTAQHYREGRHGHH